MRQLLILKMIKKILANASIGTLFLHILFSSNANAIPYSERHAFCVERSGIAYGGYYESQKKYNSCMSNAEYLIRKHEREVAENKARQKQQQIERQRQEQMKNNKFDSVFGSPW